MGRGTVGVNTVPISADYYQVMTQEQAIAVTSSPTLLLLSTLDWLHERILFLHNRAIV